MNARRPLLLALLLLVCRPSAGHAAELEWQADATVMSVPAGATQQVIVTLFNPGVDPILLLGVTHLPPASFGGDVDLSPFLRALPDTLLPGQSWTGPIATLTNRGLAPPRGDHRFDFVITGGVHAFDAQMLAHVIVYMDDSTTVLDVPVADGGRTAESLAIQPNPVLRDARVRVTLSSPGHAQLRVVDIAGRTRAELLDRELPAGVTWLPWDGRDSAGRRLAPGAYFLRLRTPSGTTQSRWLLLR